MVSEDWLAVIVCEGVEVQRHIDVSRLDVIVCEEGSELIVEEGSELIVEEGAELIVEEGAELIVEEEAELIVDVEPCAECIKNDVIR